MESMRAASWEAEVSSWASALPEKVAAAIAEFVFLFYFKDQAGPFYVSHLQLFLKAASDEPVLIQTVLFCKFLIRPFRLDWVKQSKCPCFSECQAPESANDLQIQCHHEKPY